MIAERLCMPTNMLPKRNCEIQTGCLNMLFAIEYDRFWVKCCVCLQTSGWVVALWSFVFCDLQRDYACYVETCEVQICICFCHTLRIYIDHTFGHSCLLGIWRPPFGPLKCTILATPEWCSWSCCCSHAHPSGTNSFSSESKSLYKPTVVDDSYRGLNKLIN